MKLPLQITYRDIDSSPAISDHIRRHGEKLDTFCDRIMSCRVAIEASNRHTTRFQKTYRVRIDVKVPHKELVSIHTPEDASAGNLYLTIDAAFAKMARELENYNRMSRWDVKRHTAMPRGVVTKLFHDRGYGFLEDGTREIYFHEHSVQRHKFKNLEVGTEVRFSEEEGDKGPQASFVEPIGPSVSREVERPSYV